MSFHIGQKVVCICTKNSIPFLFLKKGETYTVEAIVSIGQQLILREIPGQIRNGEPSRECGYHKSRFRPIVEKKSTTETGMAMLREILDRETVKGPSPSKVRS